MNKKQKLYKEAMLFGFILGDGWISKVTYERNGKEYRYLQIGFSGDEESLQEVKKDLIQLYGDIGKATIQTRNTHSPLYEISGQTSQMIANTKVTKRFIELGMPIGKRVEQEFLLPDWIVNGSEMTKRGFLSGFYSAEGYTPRMQANDKTLRPMGFNFHKRKYLRENLNELIKQFEKILLGLGIEYSLNITERKTSDDNLRAEFVFSNSSENIDIQTNSLNLSYAKYKDIELGRVAIYYLQKQVVIDRLQKIRNYAIEHPEESATKIAKKTGVKRDLIYQWRRRKSSAKLPNDFPTFTEFKQLSL